MALLWTEAIWNEDMMKACPKLLLICMHIYFYAYILVILNSPMNLSSKVHFKEDFIGVSWGSGQENGRWNYCAYPKVRKAIDSSADCPVDTWKILIMLRHLGREGAVTPSPVPHLLQEMGEDGWTKQKLAERGEVILHYAEYSHICAL